MVADREREIEAFVPEEYWTLDAELGKQSKSSKTFLARLVKIGDQDALLRNEGSVKPHLPLLEQSQYTVSDIKQGTRSRRPAAPFTTSTLQQEASKVLNLNSRKTMSIAQELYEGVDLVEGVVGLITYMRTDSTSVAREAQQAAREFIAAEYGKEYLPAEPPQYKTRAKGAQEAHEAIRPTDIQRTPNAVKSSLTRDQFRLYSLIWKRFVASQMENAIYNTVRVDIEAKPAGANPSLYLFRASGSTVQFKGFLAVYEESVDEDSPEESDLGRTFPTMEIGEVLRLVRLIPEQHFTQPPPRYTEATLVKGLEERGIGRPSTYAPTVAVIQNRDYVTRKDKRLYPTETGLLVNDLLVKYFPEVISYDFTANLEDHLDEIATGELEWVPVVDEFYRAFSEHLKHAERHMPSNSQEERLGRICPQCEQGELVVRYGRWGKFIGCERYPDCSYTEQWKELIGVPCRVCGTGEIVELRTRSGRLFYGCTNYNRDNPESGCQFNSWKRPLRTPCPTCGDGMLVLKSKDEAECLKCKAVHSVDSLPDEEISEPV
jgi:DNA topoisomerase-1